MNFVFISSARQPFAIGGEGDAQAILFRDHKRMAMHGSSRPVGLVQAHVAIEGAAGDHLALGGDGDAENGVSVSAQRFEFLAGGQIPAAQVLALYDEKRSAVGADASES